MKWEAHSQNPPCAPLIPKSLGNCVLISVSATPALNPMSTVSDTKLTSEPARTSQAANASAATRRAVQDARASKRATSPPARDPRVVPISSEMAEVTVIAVWRELQNAQNTRPENM